MQRLFEVCNTRLVTYHTYELRRYIAYVTTYVEYMVNFTANPLKKIYRSQRGGNAIRLFSDQFIFGLCAIHFFFLLIKATDYDVCLKIQYGVRRGLFYLSKLRHVSPRAMNKSTVYHYRFGCQVRKCKEPPIGTP